MQTSQVKWRCRRGVRELDVLFTRFVDQHYQSLSEKDKEGFHSFLNEQDPIIMDWLFSRTQCDNPSYNKILELMQNLTSS